MRDRRNTSLSISTTSYPSNTPSPVDAPDIDLVEKGRFLLLPPRTDDTALPSPLLKHAQEQQARQPTWRKILALVPRPTLIFVLLCGLFFVWRCLVVTSSLSVPRLSSRPASYNHLDGASLPQEPEPFVFQDSRGRKKWTISIPQTAAFPLRPGQYRDICSKSHAVSKLLSESSQSSWRFTDRASRSRGTYHVRDSNYVEVHEAIANNILNNTQQPPISVVGRDQQADPAGDGPSSKTCGRSLTFILETEEAGFGKSLLSLWLSYGLALSERRSFFIDDSRWQYGSYMSFFPKPPQPSCVPPPPSQIVPCPHQAAHLAVSAATLYETFGSDFHDNFLLGHRSTLSKQRKIFHMARQGYEALYSLSGDDAAYSKQRIASIREAAISNHYPVIGIHVRRGDRHPFEYEFHHDYLPLERFTTAATRFISSTPRPESINASEPVPLLIASDNPDIAIDPDWTELSDTPIRLERAQDRIVLASKRNLLPTVPQRQGNSAFIKHIDEVSGWEGGFFASLFRGLGRPNRANHLTFSSAREHRLQVEERLRAHQAGNPEKQLSEEDQKAEDNAAAMRHLVGRGYLLDLEVLGQSDHVVCAVSSATCRVLAVVMGWDKVKRGHWTNVDDGREWSWDGRH